MVDRDLGQATIVYEDSDDGTVEETVQNEHIAYFQDHWIIKIDEDHEGYDVIRRIPHQRVYHVERSVEEFEEEIRTVRDQVQSFADELRSKILPGGGRTRREEQEVHKIDIEEGSTEDTASTSGSGMSGGSTPSDEERSSYSTETPDVSATSGEDETEYDKRTASENRPSGEAESSDEEEAPEETEPSEGDETDDENEDRT